MDDLDIATLSDLVAQSMVGSRKFHQGGHQCISQRAIGTFLKKQLDPGDPIASRRGSVPVFLRKPTATCDFPGGGGGCPDPLFSTLDLHRGVWKSFVVLSQVIWMILVGA